MIRENTQGYIQHFSVFSGPRYDGSLILRLVYRRQQKAPAGCQFIPKQLLSRARFQELAVEAWDNGQWLGALTMKLFFPRRPPAKLPLRGKETAPAVCNQPPAGSFFWRSFTAEEIADFSRQTGDTNSIHLDKYPIVQGLLLWRELFTWLKEPPALQLTFQQPVYALEGIYLKKEPEELCCRGFTRSGRLLFTASLSESQVNL